MMVGHARYPALDPTRIASQSRPIIEGVLRGELGFRGVVITDSIEPTETPARPGSQNFWAASAVRRALSSHVNRAARASPFARITPTTAQALERGRAEGVFRGRMHAVVDAPSRCRRGVAA